MSHWPCRSAAKLAWRHLRSNQYRPGFRQRHDLTAAGLNDQ
ncbi:hypothetical protein EB232_04310 [Mesorhizobium sp. NZP2077]|nr:hypothetical protein EB232_04310 [Mesorhizobium sp. NZP2077]